MSAPPLRDRLSLIVITDPECGSRSVLDAVRQALSGGAPAIQIRAKDASAREMAELAKRVLDETRTAGALLFINDRVDVALAVGADGAHIGNDDLPLPAARRIAPPGFLLGRSVDGVEDAIRAASEGADYLGAGPVYATGSKADAGPVMGLEGIRRIRPAVGKVPVIGIGGIDAGNAGAVIEAGGDGVAVINAVMRAEDPRAATERLLAAVRRTRV